MSFRTLGFILLMVTQVALAQGRKPAVEDFVGIEVEHPEKNPQGTEGLFNFEKDIDNFDVKKTEPVQTAQISPTIRSEEIPSGLTTAFTLAFVLGLPGIIWFLVMNHLRQKAYIESASNIEVLEKYRRDRQQAKKAQEEFKKVA